MHEEVWRSNVLEGPVCERDALRVEHNNIISRMGEECD